MHNNGNGMQAMGNHPMPMVNDAAAGDAGLTEEQRRSKGRARSKKEREMRSKRKPQSFRLTNHQRLLLEQAATIGGMNRNCQELKDFSEKQHFPYELVLSWFGRNKKRLLAGMEMHNDQFKPTKRQRLGMEDAAHKGGYKRGSIELMEFSKREHLALEKVLSWVDRNRKRMMAQNAEGFQMHITWNEFQIANKGKPVTVDQWKELNRRVTIGALPSDAAKLTTLGVTSISEQARIVEAVRLIAGENEVISDMRASELVSQVCVLRGCAGNGDPEW